MRFIALFIALLLACMPARAQADRLLVFAAASLAEAMTEIGEAYAKLGKPKPVFSFAASSALARQIENGAPASLFISADEEWMDYLAQRTLIAAETRASLLGNTLVLVTPADRPRQLAPAPGFALPEALAGGKLALADPDSVPAGRYAKAALEHLDVWEAVERSVVRGESVRAALAFVERGEVPFAVVYATDAALTKKVAVAGIFPPDSHPPISYPLAVVRAHDTPAARAFRAFLLGPEAMSVFRKYGFVVK
jgi:molybdate transport system substrate-binding protein